MKPRAAPRRYRPRSNSLPGVRLKALWKIESTLGNETVVPRVTTSTCGSKRLPFDATAGGCALLRAAGRRAPATQTTASAAGDGARRRGG